MKEKKWNFTYRTTNLINNKYYYGCHSTDNLIDGYIGSGKALLKAIEKYGIINFKCEWINNYSTRKCVIEAEKLLVTEKEVKDYNCYNLVGGGGHPFFLKHSEETKEKIRQANIGKILSEDHKRNISNGLKGNVRPSGVFNHTKESKEKISKSLKKIWTKEKRSKLSERMKGKQYSLGYTHTNEAKNKMSIARKGIKKTEEHKRKIGDAQRGNKLSEERKKQIGLSKIGNTYCKGQTRTEKQKLNMQISKCNGILITPWGNFFSGRDAQKRLNTSKNTILRMCKNNHKIFSITAFKASKNIMTIMERHIGKTFYEMGFGFIGKAK